MFESMQRSNEDKLTASKSESPTRSEIEAVTMAAVVPKKAERKKSFSGLGALGMGT